MFFAQAFAPNPNRGVLLQQSAYQLRGAALSMRAASREPVPDATPEDIAAFEKQLSEGDARGYVSLKAEIDRLRLLSQSRLNALSDEARAAGSRIESWRARESWVYLAYVFFNLLGLMVTMCKDLPVWRTERSGEKAA